MAYLTKTMITEISHECAKSEAFTMKLGDLPNMVDAIFDGDHKSPGWVHMLPTPRAATTSMLCSRKRISSGANCRCRACQTIGAV